MPKGMHLVRGMTSLNLKKPKVKIIGSRHGEKFHETLLTKEEFKKTINFKNFYKIVSDNRDLNYEKYFSKGSKKNISDDIR